MPLRLIISDTREISSGLRSLIMAMLEKNPVKRITGEELLINKWLLSE